MPDFAATETVLAVLLAAASGWASWNARMETRKMRVRIRAPRDR